MEKHICKVCGIEFGASRYWARYCSAKCRAKSFYDKRRELKPVGQAKATEGQAREGL